jgi:ubiquinone/menaquinone biosynthesis C-methylase UbiE
LRESAFASIRILEWLSVRKRLPDLAKLREIVSPSPAVRLLDLGGGAGAATERYASGCGEITILEPDPRKVALGRRQRPGIRFEEGRGEAIPFRDGAFDRVVAVVAFHHMEDQTKVLEEMHRVLRPDGRLAILELPSGNAPGRIGRWIGGFRHGSPMAFWEPGELQAKLEATGFGQIKLESGVRCYLISATPNR